MSLTIERYLDKVLAYANRPADEASAIRNELRDHLLEKTEAFHKTGLSVEDAAVRATEEHGHPRTVGYRLRRRFPLIDVRSHGTARGWIAIGPRAVGVVAMGGVAVGVFAFGGVAAGVCAVGGVTVALLAAFAGIGLAPLAYCGIAVGGLAVGGIAIGLVACGQAAVGLWVPGAGVSLSYYPRGSAPEIMRSLDPIIGWPGFLAVLTVVLLVIMGILFAVEHILQQKEKARLQAAVPHVLE